MFSARCYSSVFLSLLVLISGTAASAQTIAPLYNFTAPIGVNGLTVANGAVVGVTLAISKTQGAEFYQLVPPTEQGGEWTQAVLYQFALSDGMPNTSLLAGMHGEYYGTTSSGGTYDVGQVYELVPPTGTGGAWSLQSIYSFDTAECPDYGCAPNGPPGIDSTGNLYVVGETSGSGSAGEILQFTPPSSPGGLWEKTVLYALNDDGTDGVFPNGGLQISSRGVVYGTTSLGGEYFGVLFSLAPSFETGAPWVYTVLHQFGATNDGSEPECGLTLSPQGVLYGSTEAGGANTSQGTVFSYDTTVQVNPYSVLLFFNGSDGEAPQTPPVLGPNGVLYGNATLGGRRLIPKTKSYGTIYQLTPPAQAGEAWTETTLFQFGGGAAGGFPVGQLAINPNGTLFGVTGTGGTNRKGVAFALVP